MQSKASSNRNSNGNKSSISNHQTDQSSPVNAHSIKKSAHHSKLNNGNNGNNHPSNYSSNYNSNYAHSLNNSSNHPLNNSSNQQMRNNNHNLNQSNNQTNTAQQLNQHSNVILLNQAIPAHQFTLGTPMISPYINLATTRLHPHHHQTPPTVLPYLTYHQTTNGLASNVIGPSHAVGYVSLSTSLPPGQHPRINSQVTNNKNYQFRMPNSPPVSSTTASGSSSQGSSTSGFGSSASSTSNCTSNNIYHSNSSNSSPENNSTATITTAATTNNSNTGSREHTAHSSVSDNLNSLSNGKLNSSANNSNNNNTTNSAQTTTNSSTTSSTNSLVKSPSNGNLMMSNNGTSNSNSSVVSQTNSTSTNGNLNPTSNNNNNNQNGSTNNNNESTNGGSYGGEQLSRTNLYIRGLSPSTTDKNLFELCSPFGKIVSTKAIIDKATNNCKGYGFVDFDSPVAAENAVKQLQLQGIEAQMAKRTDWNKKASSNNNNSNCSDHNDSNYSDYNLNNSKLSQQEQDPTNLYIANLPTTMTEIDLDTMLNPFGNVISTRILKDMNQLPRGVGFARMESREKCDLIIQNFNNKLLVGSKEPLLVKFADGGNKKKNQYKNSQGGDSRMGSGQNSVGGWRETTMNGNASGNGNMNSDQLSPYTYTPNSVQDHHSHPNPIVAHAVAAHHAVQGHAVQGHAVQGHVGNSGPHQAAVATVHQMLPFPHSLMPTQSLDQSLMNQQLHLSNLSNFNPGTFKSPAYHQHHAHRNPTYSSAQPISAQYPGAAHHYQILPGTHLQNSQQQLAMDPNAALHFMPGLAAQMQQLQLGGHSYIAGNPAYGNASQGHIYTSQAGTPLMQQMPLSETSDNHPNSTNSSVGPPDSNEINQQSYNTVYSK